MTLLLLIFTSQNSRAQYYSYDRNLSLGITINPNIGWLSYEDDDRFNAGKKVGFSYGLLADLGFAKNYYFSTGLFINSLKSDVVSPDDNNKIVTKTYRLQYAEIPLSIKLKSNDYGQNRFYGQFGFTAGVKVSGKQKIENQNNNDGYRSISGDDIFRLGLIVGTGMEWRIGQGVSALTGISYNNGFTRTMKQGSPTLSHFSLNLGLLF